MLCANMTLELFCALLYEIQRSKFTFLFQRGILQLVMEPNRNWGRKINWKKNIYFGLTCIDLLMALYFRLPSFPLLLIFFPRQNFAPASRLLRISGRQSFRPSEFQSQLERRA